ncbi:GAD-like domain-containing protein [Vibrio owensii]|uniref:GAD-like domain-containing protein n=1 Tax=Vibrio owensii TaxID=696485 RepID=UPI0038CEA7B3
MTDEYFEMFLEEFGAPTVKVNATDQEVEAYRGVLPDQLLSYWEQFGFSGFRNGLFWITNPAEFEDVLEQFLNGTVFAENDNYHVIARSAYGQLYLWGEKTGYSLSVIPHLNWIKTVLGNEDDISRGEADIAVQRFIGFRETQDIDIKNKTRSLFPLILKKYGDLGKDEVMVFTPYLFMGGKKSAESMTKENLHVYLQVMADMGGAEIVDMASMVGNTIKHYGE